MSEASRHIKALCRIMPYHTLESCLIPCPEARSIIASSTPISKALRSQKSLNSMRNSLLEDSELIKFDSVIDELTSQSKLFSAFLKSPTQDLLTGQSFSVLVFGTTGSGKSFTIRGGEGKKRGLALRSVELLLAMIDKQRVLFQIKVSVSAVFNEKVLDLLNKQEILISKSSDFHAALNQALKTRKSLSEKQQKDKIHMVITVRLYQDYELLSEAVFVELAGSEYAREDKLVARSFNSISSKLTQSSSNWAANPLCVHIGKGLDIYAPRPVNVILICCAGQGVENFTDTLASLKFTSRIKECIERDAVKPEVLQIDTILNLLEKPRIEEACEILESIEIGVKKILAENAQRENQEILAKYKQVRIETLQDIEEAKSKIGRNTEDLASKKNAWELAQVKANYAVLQEQFSNLIEEKGQISQKSSQAYVKIANDLFGCIQRLSEKLQEEYDLTQKIISESRSIRIALLKKTQDHEGSECSCSDEIKSLQVAIRESNEDRKKLMERLELSLKENRNKEEHIQALHSSSYSYEQETQHLSSVISDYETLIYELRKSLNGMSSKNSQIEEEKLLVMHENERLRGHYKVLKEKIDEQQALTEREIIKYKQENDECSGKYENLSGKIELLTLELSKAAAVNNQLRGENKALATKLEIINFTEIDGKIQRVYKIFDCFDELVAPQSRVDI